MIGYKIVRLRYGKMLSMNEYEAQIVEYNINMATTIPEGCGGLAVFVTKENAENFLANDLYDLKTLYKIYKCSFIKYSGSILRNKLGDTQKNLPNGSVLASSVTLLDDPIAQS